MEAGTAPHFGKRTAPAPDIPGLSAWIGAVGRDPRPPREALGELREARAYFGGLRDKGEQTLETDGARTRGLILPILHSENARTPGLNAVECGHGGQMGERLRDLMRLGGAGQEGHVRFHLGVNGDAHRIAVDAFRHREGGFTLIAIDSVRLNRTIRELAMLQEKHPDIIKGTAVIPTHNLIHDEGCRIFAVHALNSLHDYQPHVQGLHRELYGKGRGRSAPRFSGPMWKPKGTLHVLADKNVAFSLLPGKFFKHMQVKKPDSAGRTLLDEAEARNPALKSEPVNKKGQTLRERYASQNPSKPSEAFSYADRTASLDRKRLVLIDRAIAHYEGLTRAEASIATGAETSSGSADG